MTTTTRPTKSEIFTAYNIARAQARREHDSKKIERLNKALGILMSKSYYDSEKAEYQPSHFTCGCKDWEFRHSAKRAYNGPCKHMLAESLILSIAERREAHQVPAWVADPFVRHVSESSYRA